MRILHLVSYAVYSGPVPGVVGLAMAQRALGHDAFVAHDTRRGPFSPYEEGIERNHLDGGSLTPPVALALAPKSAPWTWLTDVVRLRRWLHAARVDVIHAHLSHDHWLMGACGQVPGVRVRTVHAERVLRPRWGQSWLWRRTDGVVVRTPGHGLALQAAGVAATTPRALVPGAVDAHFWCPASREARGQRRFARAKHGLPEKAPVLLHVGLMANRGQRELLRALELLASSGQLGNLHVALVGRGPEEQALAAQARQGALAGRVHLLGYLKAPELRALYQASDAAFVAQAGNDAAARAALEAMASALPVIAVQDGALRGMVDAVVGYPVATRAPRAIAAGLAAWLEDSNRGRARGRAARRRVLRQRTFRQEAQDTLDLYARALATRAAPARLAQAEIVR